MLPTTALLLICVVSVAGIYDLRFRRIPNWLSVCGIILGLALSTCPRHDGFRASVGGMLCALAVYVPLYLIRGMGAGDVKLMAAIGAITGPANWGYIFLVTALLGGVVSLVLVVLRRRVRQTAGNLASILRLLLRGKPPAESSPELDVRSVTSFRLPHGALIAAASILFLFAGRALMFE